MKQTLNTKGVQILQFSCSYLIYLQLLVKQTDNSNTNIEEMGMPRDSIDWLIFLKEANSKYLTYVGIVSTFEIMFIAPFNPGANSFQLTGTVSIHNTIIKLHVQSRSLVSFK